MKTAMFLMFFFSIALTAKPPVDEGPSVGFDFGVRHQPPSFARSVLMVETGNENIFVDMSTSRANEPKYYPALYCNFRAGYSLPNWHLGVGAELSEDTRFYDHIIKNAPDAEHPGEFIDITTYLGYSASPTFYGYMNYELFDFWRVGLSVGFTNLEVKFNDSKTIIDEIAMNGELRSEFELMSGSAGDILLISGVGIGGTDQ